MNGNSPGAILDSNIIIYLSKGILNSEEILNRYDYLCISIITYMEVMGFKFRDKEELEIIKELFDHIEMINITLEIAEDVIAIRQQKKMKLPDAIILATARYTSCDLLTANIKDFSNIGHGVNIVDPFLF